MKTLNEIDILTKGFLYYAIEPGKEKLSFGAHSDYHLTIHFGMNSGILDLHRTHRNGDHETLFRIHHFALKRLAVQLFPACKSAMIRFWYSNRINIGKLYKYNCILFPVSQSGSDFHQFLKMSNKGRKVRFRKDVSFQKLAGQFIEPDDLKDAKPGAFSVYRYSHKKGTFVNQGMIIKTQNQKAEGSYIFCSKKNFNLFMKNIGLHSYIALHKVEFERKKEILRMIWDRSLKKYYANRPKDGMVRPAIRAEVRPK